MILATPRVIRAVLEGALAFVVAIARTSLGASVDKRREALQAEAARGQGRRRGQGYQGLEVLACAAGGMCIEGKPSTEKMHRGY